MTQPYPLRLGRTLLGIVLTGPSLLGAGGNPQRNVAERSTLIFDPSRASGRTSPFSPSLEECRAVCADNVRASAPPLPDWKRTSELQACVASTVDAVRALRDGGVESTWVLECDYNVTYTSPPQSCGRRPAGWVPERDPSPVDLGGFLARSAELERASVDAFANMIKELSQLRAPIALIERARHAARDEVRHAKIMEGLARVHGSAPRAHEATVPSERSIEEIAIDNLVEGCIRETFGALIALAQGQRASSALLRRAMRRIAKDEVRHAELSWDVHAWLLTKLRKSEIEKLKDHTESAIRTLKREMRDGFPPDLCDNAGLPSASEASRLLNQLCERVWGPTFGPHALS